jgi:hypothetical protein
MPLRSRAPGLLSVRIDEVLAPDDLARVARGHGDELGAPRAPLNSSRSPNQAREDHQDLGALAERDDNDVALLTQLRRTRLARGTSECSGRHVVVVIARALDLLVSALYSVLAVRLILDSCGHERTPAFTTSPAGSRTRSTRPSRTSCRPARSTLTTRSSVVARRHSRVRRGTRCAAWTASSRDACALTRALRRPGVPRGTDGLAARAGACTGPATDGPAWSFPEAERAPRPGNRALALHDAKKDERRFQCAVL